MDDELQQLEAELRRLRPAAVRPALVDRVRQELAAPKATAERSRLHWRWPVLLPVAAALAIVLIMSSRVGRSKAAHEAPGSSENGAEMKPIAAENVLVAEQDEGLITLDDGTMARRARLRYVDTITWRNSRTHASLTWTVPREEVRIVPVAFQ